MAEAHDLGLHRPAGRFPSPEERDPHRGGVVPGQLAVDDELRGSAGQRMLTGLLAAAGATSNQRSPEARVLGRRRP